MFFWWFAECFTTCCPLYWLYYTFLLALVLAVTHSVVCCFLYCVLGLLLAVLLKTALPLFGLWYLQCAPLNSCISSVVHLFSSTLNQPSWRSDNTHTPHIEVRLSRTLSHLLTHSLTLSPSLPPSLSLSAKVWEKHNIDSMLQLCALIRLAYE